MTKNQKEIRCVCVQRLEVRSKEGGSDRVVTGYVVEWNKRSELIWGEFYEKVAKGAFTKSIQENRIKALWDHKTHLVLGSQGSGTLVLVEDERGLYFEIDLPNNSWGNDALESINRGDVDGVSFGFNVRANGAKWEYFADEDVYERILVDVELVEISPTPFPAYLDSQVDKRSVSEILAAEKITGREERALEKQRVIAELDLLKVM